MSYAAAVQTETQRKLIMTLPQDGSPTTIVSWVGVDPLVTMLGRDRSMTDAEHQQIVDRHTAMQVLSDRGLVLIGSVRRTVQLTEAGIKARQADIDVSPISAREVSEILQQPPSFSATANMEPYEEQDGYYRGFEHGFSSAMDVMQDWMRDVLLRAGLTS